LQLFIIFRGHLQTRFSVAENDGASFHQVAMAIGGSTTEFWQPVMGHNCFILFFIRVLFFGLVFLLGLISLLF
jgi:hypothetical protein